MSAGTLNLAIEQGATFEVVLTWREGTEDNPGALISLTGYTARMQIRASKTSGTILKSLTTENGGITLGGAAGTITLLISDEDTAGFNWTAGVYDLELEKTSTGKVTRLVQGAVTVDPEVTR